MRLLPPDVDDVRFLPPDVDNVRLLVAGHYMTFATMAQYKTFATRY